MQTRKLGARAHHGPIAAAETVIDQPAACKGFRLQEVPLSPCFMTENTPGPGDCRQLGDLARITGKQHERKSSIYIAGHAAFLGTAPFKAAAPGSVALYVGVLFQRFTQRGEVLLTGLAGNVVAVHRFLRLGGSLLGDGYAAQFHYPLAAVRLTEM